MFYILSIYPRFLNFYPTCCPYFLAYLSNLSFSFFTSPTKACLFLNLTTCLNKYIYLFYHLFPLLLSAKPSQHNHSILFTNVFVFPQFCFVFYFSGFPVTDCETAKTCDEQAFSQSHGAAGELIPFTYQVNAIVSVTALFYFLF